MKAFKSGSIRWQQGPLHTSISKHLFFELKPHTRCHLAAVAKIKKMTKKKQFHCKALVLLTGVSFLTPRFNYIPPGSIYFRPFCSFLTNKFLFCIFAKGKILRCIVFSGTRRKLTFFREQLFEKSQHFSKDLEFDWVTFPCSKVSYTSAGHFFLLYLRWQTLILM